jgi:ABC-type sugar transport system ATPase subunit
MAAPAILTMQGITKAYPGVIAVNNVDFDLRAGEVHALIGENGAGKTTLMKILSGVIPKDRGTIHLKGHEIHLANPLDAQQAGISIIYQERSLTPSLNAAQNIWLGREPVQGIWGMR